MKIYAYGIIDSHERISDSIRGIEDSAVYNIPYRDIGVAVSELAKQIQDITQDQILKHEEVIEKLMENFTVLPMRFLTQFSQEEDVLLMAKDYYHDFRENLDRLHNKVEFGVKVIWPGEIIKNRIEEAAKKYNANVNVNDDSPGKSFIKKKFQNYKIDKEFEQEANRCIVLIDDFFNRFCVERKLEKLKSDNLLLSASYLVEEERQDDFKGAFERARKTPGELKFLLSGPWPAYNFIILTKKTDMFNGKSLSQKSVDKDT